MTDSTAAGRSSWNQDSRQVEQALRRLEELKDLGASDLHIHTTHSDGYESPAEVVQHVLSNRLSAFAIADHDTLRGVEDVQKVLRKLDLISMPRPVFVPAVEISALWDGIEIHIVAYFPFGGEWRLDDFLKRQRDTRDERNRAMVEKLASHDCPITYPELAAEGGTAVGRMHMATILVRKGFSPNAEICFADWLGTNGRGFVPRRLDTAETVISVIREAGGVPVLAHPAHYCWTGRDDGLLDRQLQALRDLGLEGVETVHGNATEAQMEEIADAARRLGLLRTAGSDYHANAGYTLTLLRSGIDYNRFLH